jgi:hypothetical protein
MKLQNASVGRLALLGLALVTFLLNVPAADNPKDAKEPPKVNAGSLGGPPSDAIVLFGGQDLSYWINERGTASRPRKNSGPASCT